MESKCVVPLRNEEHKDDVSESCGLTHEEDYPEREEEDCERDNKATLADLTAFKGGVQLPSAS